MSLIPYHPREGHEIVLRHRNAIVVRDPDSQRLEIRGQTCPTCRQPLPQASAAADHHAFERPYEPNTDSFVDPDYFRMLRRGNYNFLAGRGPQSPVRSLPRPDYSDSPGGRIRPSMMPDIEDDAENDEVPIRSKRRGSRIRRDAFSPNYLKSFFVEEKTLGKGGKGVVLLVRHEIDGYNLGHFACKRVPVGDDHAWLEKALVEVELLARLSHPNLVSYRHVWLEDVRLSMFGPPVACAFILQQYCNGGDLQHYVVGDAPVKSTKEELKAQMRRRSKGQAELPKNVSANKAKLAFEEIFSLFKDITSGVAYLHAANYIHRDLKPSNCLLHREKTQLICLISDFGEVQAENAARKSTGSTGTISYCAPEVLKMDALTGRYGNFTTKSDMFSLGMILYFMCFGRLPYRSANAIQEELEDIELLRAEITDWKGFRDERKERLDLPTQLYTLLEKLLSIDPVERPSANEVLHAIKSESNFDALRRPDRGNSVLGLHGSRVQNLDSAAGSGMPMAEAIQHTGQASRQKQDSAAWAASGAEADMSAANAALYGNGSADEDDGMMSQSLTLSTGDISRYDDASASTATSTAAFIASSPRHSSRRRRDHPRRAPKIPLLLPAPRSRWAEIEDGVTLALYYACRLVGVDTQSVVYAFQLSIFLLKMVSLARPCWPYVASLQVCAPLLVVATLELVFASSPVSHSSRMRGEYLHVGGLFQARGAGIVLLAFHFATLRLAGRWDALCIYGPSKEWADW